MPQYSSPEQNLKKLRGEGLHASQHDAETLFNTEVEIILDFIVRHFKRGTVTPLCFCEGRHINGTSREQQVSLHRENKYNFFFLVTNVE